MYVCMYLCTVCLYVCTLCMLINIYNFSTQHLCDRKFKFLLQNITITITILLFSYCNW